MVTVAMVVTGAAVISEDCGGQSGADGIGGDRGYACDDSAVPTSMAIRQNVDTTAPPPCLRARAAHASISTTCISDDAVAGRARRV